MRQRDLGFAEGDSLPGIEGLIIVGDAVLGGRLTACGYPVNGTTLCIFQVLLQTTLLVLKQKNIVLRLKVHTTLCASYGI
jgi:hypothetical protein